MSGGYELISLKGEYGKHLSSVAINNVNLLSGLSPAPFVFPVLIYYSHQLRSLRSCLSEIRNICNSNSKSTCNCQCQTNCNGNFICLCECNGDKKETKDCCCICICKKQEGNTCKCVCICICKNGEDCCCNGGKEHNCGKSLAKVDLSKFGFKPSDVINHLFYIRCSLRSLTNNTINRNSGNLSVQLDKQVVSVYSLIKVTDYGVVVNRMLEWAKKIHKIFEFLYSYYGCLCIKSFEKNSGIDREKTDLEIKKYFFRDNPSDEIYKMKTYEEIKNLYQFGIDGNHRCLCMVLKYTVWPQVLNLVCVISYEMDVLSSLSRKFTRYALVGLYQGDRLMIIMMMLNLMHKLCIYMETTYQSHFVVSTLLYLKCYCTYNEDKNYQAILSMVLVISWIVQNIWTLDSQSIRKEIECLSTLYSQLEIYNLNSESMKSVCCNPVYSLIVDKECKGEGTNKCCCWCITVYNLAIILIFLCIQCKLCKALCNKEKTSNVCDKVKEFCTIGECKCPKGNTTCCLLKSLCNEQGSKGCVDLEKALEECCKECTTGNCCCKTLKEKLKLGLCKLLLIGCDCTSTAGGADGNEVKVKCLFFNDLNEHTRVAVFVFCKCAQPPPNGCCCLKTLIEKLKTNLQEKLKKICGEDCVCEDLKTVSDQICGPECSSKCADGCPCKTIKDEIEKICNAKCNGQGGGGGGGAAAGSNCLCKLIKDTIGNLCSKKQCKCATNGCSRCVCCKLIGMSIKILTRACKANVLHPYKRIVTQLLGCSKDKSQLIRTIVRTLNMTTLNHMYLVKNSYSSVGFGLDTNTSVESRNWGYDTRYEHEIICNNSYGDV